MKVSDIRDGFRRVEAEGEIAEKPEPREVNLRTGGTARVCDAILKDDSGQIKLVLWDGQIEQVVVGCRVRVMNGYANQWREELRLNVGKYGKLEVVG